MISIVVHVVLILLLALNPDWLETTPKRTIRIAGEDFDRNTSVLGAPITEEEIFSFREYLKSYKMPWKGNRLS